MFCLNQKHESFRPDKGVVVTGVRPVPLEIHIQGIDLTNMEARMQAMARPAYAAICNYTGDSKPAILFVPTRKHARSTALDMLTFAAADGKPQKFLQVSLASRDTIGLC